MIFAFLAGATLALTIVGAIVFLSDSVRRFQRPASGRAHVVEIVGDIPFTHRLGR